MTAVNALVCPSSAGLDRREVLLQIAAAVADGMPCPTGISLALDDEVTLQAGTVAGGLEWLAWFGMGRVELTALGTGYIDLHNHRVLWWHDRRVTVRSDEQPPKPAESTAAARVRVATMQAVDRAAA